ncbi:MAG: hypothetical protein KDB65_08170 [Calditrichaeota bacterium]|nr:hypothetical protein [Calditrichota bacterium]MCB9369886.1 hypothetical protein [Calditrichota bacterium]
MKILTIGLLITIAVGSTAFAAKPKPTNSLSTPPTFCDDPGNWKIEYNRVVNTLDGRIQCVSDLDEGPFQGTPEDAAWTFLRLHQDWLLLDPDATLKVERTVESPDGYHVTFVRVINGVPVYPGDAVVTMTKNNIVRFYFSSLFTFKDNPSTTASVSADQAVRIAMDYLNPKVEPRDSVQVEFVIWAGDNRDFVPAWRVRQFVEDPMGDWELLVDANTTAIRRVADRACYTDGHGYTYVPDPLTSASANYGDAGFVDGSDANTTQLQGQRSYQTLRDLTFSGGVYRLQGPYCTLIDFESPTSTPVTNVNPDNFIYTRDAQGFEDVNVYYHIDASQRWIQSLGFNNIQNLSIGCDPHGLNGDDNSHYIPSTNRLAWGEGGVDDAEDADVIWHEYGHAIQSGSVPGWGGGDEGSMGEGFGDYWAASYSHALYNFHDTWVFNWDGHNTFWNGRILNANYHYPENNNGGVHNAGQIWSQACYDAMLLTSRITMDRIVLGHHFLLGTSATMPTAAQALMTYDGMSNGGWNRWAISDACVPRGLLTRPSNDTCPGTTITSLPYTTTGSTANADHNYSNCLNNLSPDVIYTISSSALPCDASVTVSLCGSGYDTGLSVYTGGSCPGTTQVACNDDGTCATSVHSQVTFNANRNTTYYVIVHGYGNYSGSYSLSVSKINLVPSNDTCPGTAITSLPYSDTGSTTCATNNFDVACVSGDPADVFYNMTLSSCQTVTVSLCGSSYDTGLEIRAGGTCPGSTQVVCNDDNYCGSSIVFQSTASFVAQAGVTYYIIIDGYSTFTGNYVLNVTGVPFAPENDTCPGTTIASLPYSDTGSTTCATNDFNVDCVSGDPADVFYNMTLSTCQTVTISLCGSSYDTGLEIRAGGPCPGSTQVICNDDYSCNSSPTLQSTATFIAQAGVTYYIIVDGYSTFTGAYVLNATGIPYVSPNDVCPGTVVTSLPYFDTGNTRCASDDYHFSCQSEGNPESPDVMYSLTRPSCETVTVSLCGSGYDTGLEVRTGGACPGTTFIDCNDDFCDLQSQLQFVALAGVTYYILVDGYWGSAGSYALSITGEQFIPENNTCPGTAITSFPFVDFGDTRCATDNFTGSCMFSSASPDVIYNLSVDNCQTITASLCGSGFDTGLLVRTGGGCPGTTEVACNDDNSCGGGIVTQSTLSFVAQPATTYFIIVDGYGVSAGPFVLRVTSSPCPIQESPDSLVIQASGVNVQLSWPVVPGAASYQVYRKATADVSPIPADFLANVATNSFVDAGVINSQSASFYLITALPAAGLVAGMEPQDVNSGIEPDIVSEMGSVKDPENSTPKDLQGSLSYVDFVPYLNPNTSSRINYAGEVSKRGPSIDTENIIFVNMTLPLPEGRYFEKKIVPADETLRTVNFYIPAYTEFNSPNVSLPKAEPKQ